MCRLQVQSAKGSQRYRIGAEVFSRGDAEQVQRCRVKGVERLRGAEVQVQRCRCTGADAQVLQSFSRGAEVQQTRWCRAAVEVQRF